MSINSIEFFIFFIFVFILYYFLPVKNNKRQNILLLFASYMFYALADIKIIWIILVSTIVFYILGIKVHRALTGKGALSSHVAFHNASLITAFSVLLAILIIAYFKYFNFFIQAYCNLFSLFGLHIHLHTFNIILPLGISFFTFKLISYIIEIKNGRIEPSTDIIEFALFVSFFPTIVSGPIDRPGKFLPQLHSIRKFDYVLVVDGCKQVLWGMMKKMLVADRLSEYIDKVWNDVGSYSSTALIIAAVFYSFQIYFDFSGYSDMAIGVSKILGIKIAKNFNYPYFSRNISEFWRKWHMSLTSWFTDYIYIPLGGNRRGKSRTIINTLIVFTICGLWHGANWTFVLWGFLNGMFFLPLLIQKSPKKYKHEPICGNLKTILKMTLTFSMVSFSWICFRSPNVPSFIFYIKEVLTQGLLGNLGDIPRLGCIFLVCILVLEWCKRNDEYAFQKLFVFKNSFMRILFYAILFIITYCYRGDATTFIYAGF